MIEYFVCPFCYQAIKTPNYEKHLEKVHPNKSKVQILPTLIESNYDKSFTCTKCNRDFVSLTAVKQHCSHHDNTIEKKPKKEIIENLKCPYCDKQTTTKDINFHLENEHKFNISYQDYLNGKKKKELFDLETENIPNPIHRVSSDKVNCPECQVIITEETYLTHFRTDHKEKLENILKTKVTDYISLEGYSCPESKISGRIHKDVFVRGRFSSSKLETKIPKFFCYTCGKTYIAEEKYPDKQFTSKEGNTIYNYPDLLSDKVQDEHNKESTKIIIPSSNLSNSPIIQEKELGSIQLIVYDNFPKTECNYGEHRKESIVIKTKTFSNYPIEINAFYCEKCKKFFTNYESIKSYFGKTKPYISIHCEYTNNGRREFSELSLFGYNVDAKDLGYEANKRRKLLQELLDNELVEKITIINLLKSFININGKGKCMGHARDCWEDDLDFVSTYIVPKTKIINPKKVDIIYKKN